MPSEAYLLHKAQHRDVIKIYECCTAGDCYVFVMERPRKCEDLGRILFKTNFHRERRYFIQILEAIVCSEENGVVQERIFVSFKETCFPFFFLLHVPVHSLGKKIFLRIRSPSQARYSLNSLNFPLRHLKNRGEKVFNDDVIICVCPK